MADKVQVTGLTEEKIEKVNNVLQELKESAQQAYTEGDLFMLAVYEELLSVCSPIVVKSIARFQREANAEHRKHVKELRKSYRKSKEEAKAQGDNTP